MDVRIVFDQLRLCQRSVLSADPIVPLQFSLRHIFHACTAMAMLIVAREPLLAHLDVFANYLMPGIVGFMAIRASLARRRAWINCTAAVLFAGALGECIWWVVARMHDYSMVCESLMATASLLVVRSCGYRLTESECCTGSNAGR